MDSSWTNWATRSLQQLEGTLDHVLGMEQQQQQQQSSSIRPSATKDQLQVASTPNDAAASADVDESVVLPVEPLKEHMISEEDASSRFDVVESKHYIDKNDLVEDKEACVPEVVENASRAISLNSDAESVSQATIESPRALIDGLTPEDKVTALSLALRRREMQLKKQAEQMMQLHEENTEYYRQLEIARSSYNDVSAQLKQVQLQVNSLEVQNVQNEGLLQLLAAKDDQIAAVLAEGEALSKKQMDLELNIRKLRQQLKEREIELKESKETLAAEQLHKETLVTSMQQNDVNARTTSDQLATLTSENSRLRGENKRISADLEAKTELNGTLDGRLHELESTINELQSADHTNQNLRQAVDSMQEKEREYQRAVHELRSQLKQAERSKEICEVQLNQEIRLLLEQINVVSSAQSQAGANEGDLARQIGSLQQRLASSREQILDLNKQLEAATVDSRMSRESIQRLQMEVKRFQRQTEELESELERQRTENRANALQLSQYQEKCERATGQVRQELEHRLHVEQDRYRGLEIHVSQLKQSLQAKDELEIIPLKNQLEQLHEELRDALKRNDDVGQSLDIASAKQLSRSRTSSTASWHSRSWVASPASRPFDQSLDDGNDGVLPTDEEILQSSLGITVPPPLVLEEKDLEAAESSRPRQISTASRIQSTARLKQALGEVAYLRSRIATLTHQRDVLTEQLVSARARVENLENSFASYRDLEQRHEMALQLIGAKEEELIELRSDLADAKSTYRSQIEQLINQLESPRRQIA